MNEDKNKLQPEEGDDGIRKDSGHAGTDPDRYENITAGKTGSDASGAESDDDDADYKKKPKNHTTTEERLLNPDRGEK